jgi:hypothetical protein
VPTPARCSSAAVQQSLVALLLQPLPPATHLTRCLALYPATW